MGMFTDTAGREWDLEITGGTIKLAQKLLEIDLGNLFGGEPPLLTRLSTDIPFLVDVLYVICKPQADERGLTDISFASGLGGDALADADCALAGALTDFYRSLKKTAMVAAIKKQRQIIDLAMGRAQSVIESEATDKIIDTALNDIGPAPTPGK